MLVFVFQKGEEAVFETTADRHVKILPAPSSQLPVNGVQPASFYSKQTMPEPQLMQVSSA